MTLAEQVYMYTLPDDKVKSYVILKVKNTYYRVTYERDESGGSYASSVLKIGTNKKGKEKYKRWSIHLVRVIEFGFSVISCL